MNTVPVDVRKGLDMQQLRCDEIAVRQLRQMRARQCCPCGLRTYAGPSIQTKLIPNYYLQIAGYEYEECTVCTEYRQVARGISYVLV
jgi:hypothetical protein